MSIDQPLTFSRDASRPSLLRYGVHHELEDLPGRIDAVHHGVAFTREAGHADMEPFHLAVTGRGLPQLFLVHLALIQTVDDKHAAKLVGGDGSAVATSPFQDSFVGGFCSRRVRGRTSWPGAGRV